MRDKIIFQRYSCNKHETFIKYLTELLQNLYEGKGKKHFSTTHRPDVS